MYVLQDCSICYEDYTAARGPYTIPCGHVFCRPCLRSLGSTSSTCPHCRVPFSQSRVRKVICTLQDPVPSTSAPSEAERIMWQAISSAIESAEEHEQRGLLIRSNSRQAMRESGFSENLLVALDVMRLLVEVESKNRILSYHMETSRAFEASLRDQISLLEGQLGGTGAEFLSQDIQTILSEMQELKSSVRIIDETTSQIARQQNLADTPPTPNKPSAPIPLGQAFTPSNPEQMRYPSRHKPITGEASWAGGQSPEQALMPVASLQSSSPPASAEIVAPHSPDTLCTGYPPGASSSGVRWHDHIQFPPDSSQTALLDSSISDFRQPYVPIQYAYTGLSSRLSSSHAQHSGSARVPTSRIITAAYNYAACSSDELNLTAGEILKLVYESADLDDGREWVWCRAKGKAGFVPRSFLNVER